MVLSHFSKFRIKWCLTIFKNLGSSGAYRCSFRANSKICCIVLERVQPNELFPNSIKMTNRLSRIFFFSTDLNLFVVIAKTSKAISSEAAAPVHN